MFFILICFVASNLSKLTMKKLRHWRQTRRSWSEVAHSSALRVTSCVDSRLNKDETIKNLRGRPRGSAVCSLTSQRADACRRSTGTEPLGEAIMEEEGIPMQIASRCSVPPVTCAEWLSNKCPGSPVLEKKRKFLDVKKGEKEKNECVSADGSRFLPRKEMCESERERDHWNKKMASDWLHSVQCFYLKLISCGRDVYWTDLVRHRCWKLAEFILIPC